MTIFALTNFLIAFLSVILGVFAYIKNKKDPVNYNWFFTSISIAIWSLSFGLVVSSRSYDSANIWQYILDASSIWVAGFFLLFVYSLVGIKDKNKLIYYMTFIPAALVMIFSFSPLFRNGLAEVFQFKYWVNPGPLYFVSPFVYSLYVLSSLIILFYYQGRVRGAKKLQLRYITFAAIIGFGGGATNFFPQIFNIYPFGNYFIILYVIFITYAIVKHRLMDIRLVVARSVAYAVLIAILAGIYAGAVLAIERVFFPENVADFNWTAGILRTVLAVIMAFTFQPLRRWITRITDRVFFKNQYDPEQLLDTLAHTIGSTIVLIELVYKTLDLLMGQMKITRGMFIILNENGSVYNAQASGYKESPEVKKEDIEKLAKDGILIYDELEESSHYKTLLRKYDAAASIPLKTESAVEGLLILGEKASGDMFSEGDLKVFEIIAPEIAVAITNAKAFEKIEKFNVTLRQEVKKATSELEKKNEQLRELDKAKDEFISMASHQLRTPLTAIKGYLSMLLEGDAGEIKVSQYDFVNEAFSGANRMVGLINDLLNVSRMETGRFFLEPVEVDMPKLVTEEVKQLENHAKEKKLYLKLNVKGKIPHTWVDETKIRQVVMNFIDNALYYTTEGGVSISLEADKKNIIFKVTDTGIGVPKEAQKNLFTKFYRADNARHVRPDGTGLGIYLAKRVMDDHGGEILFHSEEGKGSTFGFKLPIKSHLKIKRTSAPLPNIPNSSPPVGELAAGIGVSPEEIEKTEKAGLEKPLPDTISVTNLTEQADSQKMSVTISSESKG